MNNNKSVFNLDFWMPAILALAAIALALALRR